MADSPSLYESLAKLEGLVDDLRKLLHGDQATRAGGLLAEFDALRAQTQTHNTQIQELWNAIDRLRRRRPVIWIWLTGFACFVVGFCFLIIAGVNASTPVNWLDAPPPLAFGLSLFLLIVSAPLFISGFGWLDGK